jgi:hypothetical protein
MTTRYVNFTICIQSGKGIRLCLRPTTSITDLHQLGRLSTAMSAIGTTLAGKCVRSMICLSICRQLQNAEVQLGGWIRIY